MTPFNFFIAVLALLAFAPSAPAKTTEPGQETIWDQIMAAQSQRELITGSEYMEQKDYEKAIQEFSKAVISNPKDPSGHLMLGAALYWSGKIEQAESEFRETLKLDPHSAQGHMLTGIVHAWRGDSQSAYKSFQEAEKYAPNRPDIEMNLGSIETSLGLYPQALDHYRKAVSLDPNYPLYHYQLGLLYRRLGRNADAVESFERALKKYPEFEDALLEIGAALERDGKPKEAQDAFSRAVRLKSRDSVARLRLGRAYLLTKEPQKARDAFKEAFHLTPESAGGGLALSVSFGGQSRAKSDAASGPLEKKDSADPMNVLARNLERLPLDKDAQLQIEMAIIPKPELTPARSNEPSLKRALEQAGRPAAPHPGTIAVKREFTLGAGTAEQRKKQIETVMADLQKVAKQAPPDAEVRMGMNLKYSQPSRVARAGGDAEDSPKASFQPHQVGNDLGLWVMGTAWMDLVDELLPEPGDPANHPNEALWWVTDGLAYASLGSAPLALQSFEKALVLEPREEQALLGKAVALVEMGREKEAIAAYKDVLANYPKNRAAKEGLAWLLRGPASKTAAK